MYGESDGRLSISKPIRVNPSLMSLLAPCCEIRIGRYPVPDDIGAAAALVSDHGSRARSLR
jgi:hypothetical protein